MSKDAWLTRDKRWITISKMTDEHLINTIKLLRRRASFLQIGLLSKIGRYMIEAPDGAADAAEIEASRIIAMNDEEFLAYHIPAYLSLIEEAAKRSLKL